MAFNSYEELKAAVAARRSAVLTLEVDMGAAYSPEYEEAKTELQQARGMKTLMGGQAFLADNIAALEQRVADTRPEANSVFVQYRQLDLVQWASLIKTQGLSAVDQYEKVLKDTFIGVYGADPVRPDELPDDAEWKAPEPLSTDPALLSSKGNQGILPGGSLHQVVQAFISWQNSGGDVSIRPTKSGLV